MDWDQIKTNWTEMARRIRADVHCGKIDDGAVLQRPAGKGDAAKSAGTTRLAAMSAEITRKRNRASPR